MTHAELARALCETHEERRRMRMLLALADDAIERSGGPPDERHVAHLLFKQCLMSGRFAPDEARALREYAPALYASLRDAGVIPDERSRG